VRRGWRRWEWVVGPLTENRLTKQMFCRMQKMGRPGTNSRHALTNLLVYAAFFPALIFAHLNFCAFAIFRRDAAEIIRFGLFAV